MEEEVKLKNQKMWHGGGLAIGVRVSSLKERKIKQCLSCTRPKCNGCPKTEERWKKHDRSNKRF